MLVFRVTTPYGLAGKIPTCKRNILPSYSGPHGVTAQRTNNDIFSAVRTSNLIFILLVLLYGFGMYVSPSRK
jgi:hypothetical protein